MHLTVKMWPRIKRHGKRYFHQGPCDQRRTRPHQRGAFRWRNAIRRYPHAPCEPCPSRRKEGGGMTTTHVFTSSKGERHEALLSFRSLTHRWRHFVFCAPHMRLCAPAPMARLSSPLACRVTARAILPLTRHPARPTIRTGLARGFNPPRQSPRTKPRAVRVITATSLLDFPGASASGLFILGT